MRVDWDHYWPLHALTSKKPSKCQVTTQAECSPALLGVCALAYEPVEETPKWQGGSAVATATHAPGATSLERLWSCACGEDGGMIPVECEGMWKRCRGWHPGLGRNKPRRCCTKPAARFTAAQPAAALVGIPELRLCLAKAPGWKGAGKGGGELCSGERGIGKRGLHGRAQAPCHVEQDLLSCVNFSSVFLLDFTPEGRWSMASTDTGPIVVDNVSCLSCQGPWQGISASWWWPDHSRCGEPGGMYLEST